MNIIFETKISAVHCCPIPECPDYFAGSCGAIFSNKWKRLKQLRPQRVKNGYLIVTICKDGYPESQYVHRLVARTFKGDCPPDLIVCHGPDHDKANCQAANLRYDTRAANARDFIEAGVHRDPRGKLDTDKVRSIRDLFEEGWSKTALAERFSVSTTTILNVVGGRHWKHVL